ncbi:MAG: ATP-binding protein, partial [Pseudomonadota bacterium]
LNQLAIQVDEDGQLRNKHLNFSFTRIMGDGEIQGVLTSVTDITREVMLARELESETRRNEQQLEMISALMGADGEMLPEFINSCSTTYACVNELLRNPADSSEDLKDKANAMVTLIHAIKGEAAALGLAIVSETCHEFESQVEALTNKSRVSGDEFLSLTVLLDSLISTNQQIKSLYDSVFGQAPRGQARTEGGDAGEDINGKLSELAMSVANRQQKNIALSIAGFDNRKLSPSARLHVASLASQLLRNAIAHGIELPDERRTIQKPTQGQVSLVLYDLGSQGYRLVCEDDGAGVDYKRLARSAVEAGLMSKAEAARVDPRKLISLMLANRLSTRTQADADAGRGAGMSVIGDLVGKLGAKISVQSKADRGTRFTVRIPALLEAAA